MATKDKTPIQEQKQQQNFFPGHVPTVATSKKLLNKPVVSIAETLEARAAEAPISQDARQVTETEMEVSVGNKVKRIQAPVFVGNAGRKTQQERQKNSVKALTDGTKVESLKAAVKQAFAALDAAKQAITVLEAEANKLVERLSQQVLSSKNVPKADHKKGR